jgi:glucoamylase
MRSVRRARASRRTTAVAGATALLAMTIGTGVMASAASSQTNGGSASGGPGSTPYWNDTGGQTQGFATALSSTSKVWWLLADGQLQNAIYPETDSPDTYGLQYFVTDGSSFTDSETANTTHAVSLADPTSLTFTQTNTATNGDFTITKTYVADPARSVILVQTTFKNTASVPLHLYVDYQPYLANDGNSNSGGTDPSGDLVADNTSGSPVSTVASALAASTGFSEASTGYVGTSSSGVSQLSASHGMPTYYTGTSSSGHIDQTAEIPVASSGSTTFTLALAFDTNESAAVSDASASLAQGFSSVEASYEAGWHNWIKTLNEPPASVLGNASLLQQYYVALMEVKADEDKTYTGAFVASPAIPWGASVQASAGQHGYHAVWTRDEYEMASTLLAAGDSADASAALTYIYNYEDNGGQVKQNTWLNGNNVFGSNQEDEEADPIILDWQLGRTGSSDFANVKALANYITSHGPYTNEERWEETGGYSPSTIATEIAGLVCAATLATDNGDSSDASSWLSTARSWASSVAGWTYTTTGPYGNGSYFLRITPDQNPNSGASIGLANGGGSHDDRTVVDQGFLELVRLGIMAASNSDITNSLSVTDSQIGVNTPEGLIDHRYNFDGYGETSSGGDYTGAGVGNPWPVLTGERGEYDLAHGSLSSAASALNTMAGAAYADQISEQVWGNSTSQNGFTFGKPDNSDSPLMWAMAQFDRLAIDISAGTDVDTPSLVCGTFNDCTKVGVPGAPTGLQATANASGTSVALSWTASAGASSYTVYRSLPGESPSEVGTSTSTSSTDATVSPGTTYTYFVTATNGSGTGPDSAPVNVTTPGSTTTTTTGSTTTTVGTTTTTVGSTTTSTSSTSTTSATVASGVTETVNVTVPVNTAASGDTVYLAGNLSVLGEGQSDWAANGVAMTEANPTHWTAKIHAASAATLAYKYVLGGNWSDNEVSASCAQVANRSMAVNGGTENDVVSNWEGPNTCGSAQAVIDVSVPSSTPAGDTVYIAGNFSALGIGMSSANDWAAGLYPMNKIGTNEWQILVPSVSGRTLDYKFDLNGTWSHVEETGSCGTVANRTFYFNGAGSSYTASDTVGDWAGLNGC